MAGKPTDPNNFTPWLTDKGVAVWTGLAADQAGLVSRGLSELGVYDKLNKMRKYNEAIADPKQYMENRLTAISGVKKSVEDNYKVNLTKFLEATGDLVSAEKYAKARATQDLDFHLGVIEASFPAVDDVLAKLAARRLHNVEEGMPIGAERP